MKIERATAAEVEFVALHMRDRDFQEFSAVSHLDDRTELAASLAQAYGGREDVLCGAKDEPICIGITVESRPNVVTLGFMATDRFPEIGKEITKFTRDLIGRYEEAGVHRVEAVSLDGYEQAHRWLELLGLEREAGPFRGYGKGGEDFVQFARVTA